MPQEKARPEPRTFEEAFARLERIVQRLEQGDLSLEESTQLYEEGISLARLCNELLNRAELRISRLQTSYGEQLRLAEDSPTPNDEEEDEAPPDQG
ncbi:MAG: exodeoxyribonuclease VII small subunit [Dehalococcoidia bacterium]|nr:exodeoxyribonuclease VII small subunit [Dehalococcoidia bacterium]MDW8119179.1 exodeoxyribonuclease VII small subunit [Chloroflexota bacterium]